MLLTFDAHERKYIGASNPRGSIAKTGLRARFFIGFFFVSNTLSPIFDVE
jgi:hypothetical protein